jgi:hypothetical protein
VSKMDGVNNLQKRMKEEGAADGVMKTKIKIE